MRACSGSSHAGPCKDITSIILRRYTCMLWIISRNFLSPNSGISIISVETNLGLNLQKTFIQNFWHLSLSFLANSNLAFSFLLLLTGLNLVVWPLYFWSWCFLWTVDCEIFTPSPWRLLVMILTVVLGFFFLTMFLSSSDVVFFLGRPVQCLLISTPVIPFSFNTFQVVVLTGLIDFPSSKWIAFLL